ncbi:MAG: hypothetical protein ACKVHO_03155 [Verrucomicrobiia bacterium]
MRRFITLLPELDGADDAAKLRALTDYFRDLPDGAGAWAVWLFLGNRPERLITNAQLREGVIAETKLPAWLVDESCKAVDDPCETFALLLDTAGISSAEGCPWSLDVFLRKTIPRMSGDDATAKRKEFGQIWRNLSPIGHRDIPHFRAPTIGRASSVEKSARPGRSHCVAA